VPARKQTANEARCTSRNKNRSRLFRQILRKPSDGAFDQTAPEEILSEYPAPTVTAREKF